MKATTPFILALGLAVSGTLSAADQPQRPRRPLAMLHAQLLKMLDKDGDGRLSAAERQAGQEQFKTNHPEMFAKVDTNGDGTISPDERQAARAVVRSRIVGKFDQDGDGGLSQDEREAAKGAFRKRMGR